MHDGCSLQLYCRASCCICHVATLPHSCSTLGVLHCTSNAPTSVTTAVPVAHAFLCPVYVLQDTALSIAAMQRDAGLECDDETYLDSFRPTLMDVFYDWSLGKSFAEVGGRCSVMVCVRSVCVAGL